ncbi:transmembrane and TPR repeat-containing protein 3-like [Tropilaelaps mercedesae]|uniref:dolichyl-phosphate-mannose--protein mannosyltransferase n=1 Tax=Tropilaelaps mercedesae TaxID=418985 RepID=A0A1V9XA17_9ACAR|nr:transmembrane and TPR repeat-containing protein 3-like [Tropilaelaps mercedesae]
MNLCNCPRYTDHEPDAIDETAQEQLTRDLHTTAILLSCSSQCQTHPSSKQYALVVLASLIVYGNSTRCGFVFDDLSAIVSNRDVHGSTTLLQLLTNDYWGTPMHMEHSHKSYRPLSVLSFRISHALHGLQPFGYHLANVLLHAAVSASVLRFSAQWLTPNNVVVVGRAPFLCALLFAIHPIHTEAVTGVVGRAELLSGLFLLWSLMFCQSDLWTHRLASVVLCVLATLSKEQGFMAFPLCVLLNVLHRVPLSRLLRGCDHKSVLIYLRADSHAYATYVLPAALLFALRYRLMNGELPVFTRFDNPAASADSPDRQLTFAYLVSVNIGLLLFPFRLCCDWTMGSIPLLNAADPRNVATVALFGGLLAVAWRLYLVAASGSVWELHRAVISLAMLVFPFIPASNVFFPVGFVVAERVLYVPSIGFCMLIATGAENVRNRSAALRWCYKMGLFILCGSYMAKTVHRNFDWSDELSIYRSGLRANPNNAKLFNNVGFAYQQQENYERALEFFRRASHLQPDDIGSWINVGRALNKLARFSEAEAAYSRAHSLLPRRSQRTGVTSNPAEELRVAPVHLNVFVSLANLITRNNSRLHEADTLYREAIAMKRDYVDAYTNRGEILLKMGRLNEAVQVYSQAVQLRPFDPDVHFNLGVVLVKLDRHSIHKNHTERAAQEFLTVLKLDQAHQSALLSLSVCIQNISDARLHRRLVDRVEELALSAQPKSPTGRAFPVEHVWFNLAMACVQHASQLGASSCTMDRAELFFRRALALRPDFRSALFNLGVLLFEQRKIADSVDFLERLVQWHPDHIKGLMLLADIHMIHRGDKDRAKLVRTSKIRVRHCSDVGVFSS